jgi:phosphomannomutase
MTARASFLSYTPVALAFGTSGLRGLVVDITDLEAYINVKGGLRYLIGAGDVRPGASVVLAGDLRPSTDRIMRAAARAIVDAGCVVENAGKVPTPALTLRAVSTGRAGVMVTGSHIPFDRNGIKINKSVGEVLKDDEPGIVREVERVRAEEYAQTAESSRFTPTGALKVDAALPPVDPAAEVLYVARYVEGFTRGGLAGETVLVYEHSAVGRDLLGRVLRDLGADVVAAGRAETFIPIDTENVTDELLDRLEGLVVAAESSGKRPDVLVSTDGDSDRPLVAAVLPPSVDASGRAGRRVRFLSGDLLGIVVAEHIGARAVAVPISANDAVERRMASLGVHLEKTKIGSPYVVAAIDALTARKDAGVVAGWEANGGFLLGSTVSLGGRPLERLVTRDAVLPILANLYAARAAKVTLDSLWSRLPARYGKAGLLDNVPVAVSRAILKGLVPPGEQTEVAVDPGGAVRAVLPTVTPLAPAAEAAWRATVATLARFFTAKDGFGVIERVNVMDGVRVYFAGGDVAHVRPSGNAPQLRVYSLADTQARADRIVELGLREPDGILRQLEKAFA